MPRRHPLDPGPSEAIGQRVAGARRAAGLTQKELAAELQVSERAVQGWEEGQASPYRRLAQLETALGRPGEWILYGDRSDRSEHERSQQTEMTGIDAVLRVPETGEVYQRFAEIERKLQMLAEQIEETDRTVAALAERLAAMTAA